MRRPLKMLFFDLWIGVSFASAGIIDSFILGLHSVSAATAINGQQQQQTSSQSLSADQIGNDNASGYARTNSSSVFVPTADGGQLRVDLCEGDIVVPLSFDVKKEMVFKSSNFPFKRSTPVICSWNVRATTNCRRGLVTMTINERSRLADVDGCRNGYYTVSPFMEDAKICGRINTVPVFRWYVEHEHPENVTITLRHIGLHDGYSEGLSFNLSGDCLPNRDDTTISKAWESYGTWLQQLSEMQWTTAGGPTVVLPWVSTTQPTFSNDSTTPLLNNETVVVTVTTASPPDVTTTLSPQTAESSTTISTNLEINLQSNVSNTSSLPMVDLPRENVTSLVYPILNSSEVLPSAQPTTQQPSQYQQTTDVPVDLATEDHGDIPWLILKPLGESLAELHPTSSHRPSSTKVHPTPSPRPSSTKRPTTVKPGVVVIPADVLPNNIHPVKHVHNTESEMPWLVLKTPDRNQVSVELYASKNKPSDQLDVVKEDAIPFYDYDESADSSENDSELFLDLDADPEVNFSLERPETIASYLGGYDLDERQHHGPKVPTAENGNAIPWLILKNRDPSSSSKHDLPFTPNSPTDVQPPAFDVSRAPSMTSQSSLRKSHLSSTEKTLVDRASASSASIGTKLAESSDQPVDVSNSVQSALDEPVVTMNRLDDKQITESPASTTPNPTNVQPVFLSRNPLLAFDD